MVLVRCVGSAAFLIAGGPLLGQSAAITESESSFSFTMNGSNMRVTRSGPSCPSSCIQPMRAAAGVETFGELEVIDFLQDSVSDGSGLLIDVRMPSTFSAGTVPGAVNVPVKTFRPDNPYRSDLLSALGVQTPDSRPGFADAFTLVIFGDGPDDADATAVIDHLLDAGYPAGKISYYRGGAARWSALGLNTTVGQ